VTARTKARNAAVVGTRSVTRAASSRAIRNSRAAARSRP
jgi:hypothetical protein